MINIPPGPLTRRTARVLADAINGLSQRVPGGFASAPPDDFFGGVFAGEDVSAATQNRPFRAKITQVNTVLGLYGWTQQMGDPSLSWTDYDGGYFGSVNPAVLNPAYEANLNVNVPVGFIVTMRRAYLDPAYDWVYVFDITAEAAVIRLVSSVPDPVTGWYDAYTQYYDPVTETWTDVTRIWAVDVNA